MKLPSRLHSALLAGCILSGSLAAANRPNILYIFTDDQSRRSVGCYPGAHPWVQTPHIDRLAGTGMRFSHGYTGAWCQPSRACMLTGRLQYAHDTLRISNYPMATYDPKVLRFWPSVFREHGYETACIGKWHLGEDIGHGRDWDHSVIWDRGAGNRYAYYENTLVRHNGGERVPLDGYSTDRYTELAVDYITRNHAKPWFLWLCYGAVHGPYTEAERHQTRYAGSPEAEVPADIFGPRPSKPFFQRDWTAWRKDAQGRPKGFDAQVKKYHRAVAALDESVGELVAALEASGQLENTLIVYTSDQGFAWGQHGFRHKWAPYDANLCAPLIFSWPASIPEGAVCTEPVTGLDVVRTFHSIAGIKPAWKMHGRDLAPLLRDPQAKWNAAPMLLSNSWQLYGTAFTQALIDKNWKALEYHGSRAWIMMRKGPWKYIRYAVPNCIEELYDLETDPGELDNLAVQEKHHDRLLKFRREAEREFLKNDGGFINHLPTPALRP